MKYPCTSVNGICWEGTWALVSTFVASIYLSHLEMKHWWHTETCCRIFKFSTSALNRRAFKEEALPCSVSDFSHFSLILLNLTADCRPVHLYAVLTRSGIFCPKSLYNAPRQSHSRDKKNPKTAQFWWNAIWRCCNSATFYYMRTHSIIYF